jgi:hypothetical protein
VQKIAGNVPASAPAVASMRMENFVTAVVSFLFGDKPTGAKKRR